jgi:hypothetical protein
MNFDDFNKKFRFFDLFYLIQNVFYVIHLFFKKIWIK